MNTMKQQFYIQCQLENIKGVADCIGSIAGLKELQESIAHIIKTAEDAAAVDTFYDEMHDE